MRLNKKKVYLRIFRLHDYYRKTIHLFSSIIYFIAGSFKIAKVKISSPEIPKKIKKKKC